MATVICFGPNDSYFFNSPTQWAYNNLPQELTNILMAQPKIQNVHELALGPNGSYLMVYTNAQGNKAICHNGLSETLRNWLIPQPGHGIPRDFATINVSLNASGGFFAFDKNSCIRENLHPAFEAACQQRMDAQGQWLEGQFPENVSFGPDGAYVLVTRGGTGAWNFNGHLQDLQNFLQQSKSLQGVYPILSPYHADVHATCFANGHTWASVPTHCLAQFQIFEADFKAACQRAAAQKAAQAQAQQVPHAQQPHVQQQHAHPQQAQPRQLQPQQATPQQAHPQQVHPQQVHPQQAHPQQVHPQQVHPQQVHPQQAHPQQHGQPQRPGAHPVQGTHAKQPSKTQTALAVMKNVNTGLKLMNSITGSLTGGSANSGGGGGLIPNFNFNPLNNNNNNN